MKIATFTPREDPLAAPAGLSEPERLEWLGMVGMASLHRTTALLTPRALRHHVRLDTRLRAMAQATRALASVRRRLMALARRLDGADREVVVTAARTVEAARIEKVREAGRLYRARSRQLQHWQEHDPDRSHR